MEASTKACFGLLQKYLRLRSNGGLTKVEVLDGIDASGTITFKDVSELEAIFALILERTFKHFGQANGTPFMETLLKHGCGQLRRKRNRPGNTRW